MTAQIANLERQFARQSLAWNCTTLRFSLRLPDDRDPAQPFDRRRRSAVRRSVDRRCRATRAAARPASREAAGPEEALRLVVAAPCGEARERGRPAARTRA